MVSIEEIRTHLSLGDDQDDELIAEYKNAAISYIEQKVEKKLVESDAKEDEILINADIKLIILQLVSNAYKYRESTYSNKVVEMDLGVTEKLDTYLDYTYL